MLIHLGLGNGLVLCLGFYRWSSFLCFGIFRRCRFHSSGCFQHRPRTHQRQPRSCQPSCSAHGLRFKWLFAGPCASSERGCGWSSACRGRAMRAPKQNKGGHCSSGEQARPKNSFSSASPFQPFLQWSETSASFRIWSPPRPFHRARRKSQRAQRQGAQRQGTQRQRTQRQGTQRQGTQGDQK